jgi:hypothetical protein
VGRHCSCTVKDNFFNLANIYILIYHFIKIRFESLVPYCACCVMCMFILAVKNQFFSVLRCVFCYSVPEKFKYIDAEGEEINRRLHFI